LPTLLAIYEYDPVHNTVPPVDISFVRIPTPDSCACEIVRLMSLDASVPTCATSFKVIPRAYCFVSCIESIATETSSNATKLIDRVSSIIVKPALVRRLILPDLQLQQSQARIV